MTLSDYGLRVLGLDALLQKIDRVIRRHIGKSWVPQEVAEHRSRKLAVSMHLESLGCPLDELAVEELHDDFCESFVNRCSEFEDTLLDFLANLASDCMLCGSIYLEDRFSLSTCHSDRVEAAAEYFANRQIQQVEDFQEELDEFDPELSGATSAFMRSRIRRLLERNFAAAMDAPDVLSALGFTTVIEQEIRETLLESRQLPVRLMRFYDSLSRPLIDSSMRILGCNLAAFKAQAQAVFQHCILESYRVPFDPLLAEEIQDNVFGTLYLDIKRALSEVVLEHLLIPCFVGKVPPFAREAFENVTEVPPENCAQERAAFVQRLMTIDEIIAELESIDDAPPGAEEDAGEAELESASAAKAAPVRTSQTGAPSVKSRAAAPGSPEYRRRPLSSNGSNVAASRP